eukprot:113402_1
MQNHNYTTRRDCRDRTQEFFSTVAHLPGGVQSSAIPSGDDRASSLQPRYTSHDQSLASRISKEIDEMSKLIVNLEKLVSHASPFNDPAQEIQSLSHSVRQRLKTAQHTIDSLEDTHRNERTAGHGGQSSSANANIVNALRSRLAELTKHFVMALRKRTENLRRQNTRQNQFSSPNSTVVRHRPRRRMPLHDDDLDAFENESLMENEQKSSQTQMDAPRVHEKYTESRFQAVRNIEKMVHEVGELYQMLMSHVTQQDEQIISIHDNVDTSQKNIEAGHRYLLQTFDRVRRNRWLILKIFAVLIVFAIIFVGLA